MKIVVYGLTITSSWGNGHATTYRSLLKALAGRGHQIVFVEKDVEWYRNNRDLPRPAFCSVELYEDWAIEETRLIRHSLDADAAVVGSYFPDAIAASQALFARAKCPVLFYDIDTPITLRKLRESGSTDYVTRRQIPSYSAYLSFTSGPALLELENSFGARRALAFFCSVDPEIYHPTAVKVEFQCALSYLGTYASDRQSKLMNLLNRAAGLLPAERFVVAGPQYPATLEWSGNVQRMVHVPPPDHPTFYSSSRFTLNLTRDNMVAAGYSPSVRLFEASACGVAIISDSWPGLEEFLKPGEEILLPSSDEDVARMLTGISDEERKRMGARARERILATHTSNHRAVEFERIVSECA
ncbi:CgeB family protein [Granulicella arctica]|uniref:CgeB family protein n=1 Tax=Granulicella arctica TaxID=940613 RepID=UPI0021DFEBD0|nr:glycosyltransferase [Granulicella arctica]